MSLLFFSLIFPVTWAQVPPFSERDLREINCIVFKDPLACEQAFLHAPSSPDAKQFAEVGCEEGRSGKSCLMSGDWYLGQQDVVQGQAQYRKSCALGIVFACARLVEELRKSSELLSGQALADVGAETNLLKDAVCKASPLDEKLCQRVQTLNREIQRGLDPEFGDCSLKYATYSREAQVGNSVVVSAAKGLSALLTRSQCEAKCEAQSKKVKPEYEEFIYFQGRCVFRQNPLPSLIVRYFASDDTCSARGNVLGDSEALFERCHCEMQTYSKANEILEPLGAVAMGDVGAFKTVGRSKWYHCALSVVFSADSASPRSKEACERLVPKIKLALAQERSVRGLPFNFKTRSCEKR